MGGGGQEKKTLFLTFDYMALSVTLTFELQTWVLHPIHRLMMVNSFAKSFQNLSRNGKVMDWTIKKDPIFDL